MVRDVIKEFRQFLLRGNVVDLAVAVVIGAAFTAVVNSMVKDLITPLITAIGGKPNFANLSFKIHGSVFMYGDFLNALISFIIIAAVVFFFVVQPVNKLIKLANRGKVKEAEKDPQLELLGEIRDLLKEQKK
jgi:large conductance mechanosensitive channel